MADNERMEDDVNVDTDESGRRVRGRGGIEPMDAADSERYSGQGAVFERLDSDNLEPGQPIKCAYYYYHFTTSRVNLRIMTKFNNYF